MARPRKYKTEAEAKAAQREQQRLWWAGVRNPRATTYRAKEFTPADAKLAKLAERHRARKRDRTPVRHFTQDGRMRVVRLPLDYSWKPRGPIRE